MTKLLLNFFFLLLQIDSSTLNGRTSLVTISPSLNLHRLLGSRTISMEKQEIVGTLLVDSRTQEDDLETVITSHNEQEWPKDWRAYAACFAGFCGMALCW